MDSQQTAGDLGPFRSRRLQIYFLVASKGAKLLNALPAQVQPQARMRCWRLGEG